MPDVFLSYARANASQALAMVEGLRALGYVVWIDEQLPAHRAYSDVIEEQLRDAKAVVVVWSVEGTKSEWVRSEANAAREARKLVQLSVDRAKLPMPFDQIQCADLTEWTNDLTAPVWRKVLDSIAELVGAPTALAIAEPTPLGFASTGRRVPPGNLPTQATSFVGRDAEVAELVTLLRQHRLVTLTGVGGVGKTRLAVRVAAQLNAEFPDGVWLVELAPISDPAAVADAVAMALGVMPQAGRTMSNAIAEALSGRRVLVVLDNCEHVVDAAADVVETLLARTEGVAVIATSREGLQVGAEHVWPVPSLDVDRGPTSTAVQLFVERAQAVKHGFVLGDAAEAQVVMEICDRLDGIALAIELAAARMVAMNPPELLARLTDRFRLLAGSRRGMERHQTLRQAVQWSYDLLTEDERTLLRHCSVFAGGFDLAAASSVCGEGFDEYAILDLLESLVRKSLVTVEQVANHTRYGMLETIRQFAEGLAAVGGTVDMLRDRHAKYFAEQAITHWEIWDGPGQGVAIDWVDVEFANLRAGFRWSADKADLETAAAIAAHTTVLSWAMQRFESIRWVEEILAPAAAAGIAQLPRLYTAGLFTLWEGHHEAAIGYAKAAVEMQTDPRYDPFEPGWTLLWAGIPRMASDGRTEDIVATCTELATQQGMASASGPAGRLFWLPMCGKIDEAMAIADAAVAAARAHANPFWIAITFAGYGRAFAATDPARALSALRRGITYARENRILYAEYRCMQEIAAVEGSHGTLEQALLAFEGVIDAYHRAGNVIDLQGTFGYLALLFDRNEQPEVATTLYGASHRGRRFRIRGTQDMLERLRGQQSRHLSEEWRGAIHSVLDAQRFQDLLNIGAAMDSAEAVQYARQQIQQAQRELAVNGRTGAGTTER